MKLLPLIGALLLSSAPALLLAVPVKSADDKDIQRIKGFYYGYVYGVGTFLCGLAIDKEIDKEYAKKLFADLPNTVKKQSDSKYWASTIDNAYRDILQDVVCKEVYQ